MPVAENTAIASGTWSSSISYCSISIRKFRVSVTSELMSSNMKAVPPSAWGRPVTE